MRIFLRKLLQYQKSTSFYLIKSSFGFSLKRNFSWSCEVATRNSRYNKHGDSGWEQFSVSWGSVLCLTRNCSDDGENSKFLSQEHVISVPRSCTWPRPVCHLCCYFSCWQLWERFYFRGRTNLPISRSFRLPRPSWSIAAAELRLQPPRPGLTPKPRSKACLVFSQVNPYLLRIRLVSSNPLVLHEKIKWMDGKR